LKPTQAYQSGSVNPIFTGQKLPQPSDETIGMNDQHEEDAESWFSKPTSAEPPPPPNPEPGCVPTEIEPPTHQLDTRIGESLFAVWHESKMPHDCLWPLEMSFPFNFHNAFFHSAFFPGAVKANTAPANAVLHACRPGGPLNSTWNKTNPAPADQHASPNHPNPSPAVLTSRNWENLCHTKWRTVHARHATTPCADAASCAAMLDKVPAIGFKNGSVVSTAELTSNYNSAILFKEQFTSEETKIHACMCCFKDTKFLPTSIQSATSASDANPLFSPWSVSDLNDLKAWALSEDTTVNMHHMSGAAMTACLPHASLKQWTPSTTTTSAPSAADIVNNLTTTSQACPRTFSQDPKGHGHILPSMWAAAPWDGAPTDPIGKTNEELCAFLKPANGHNLVIRGIHDLFCQVNPFNDNQNPTVAEIDNWNIEVVRHFRRMFGTSTPVNLDARLTLDALWASERKHTQDWDSACRPDCGGSTTKGGPCGPCFNGGTPVDTSGGHCGAAFWPSES